MTDHLKLEGVEVSIEDLCEWINNLPGDLLWPGGVEDDD